MDPETSVPTCYRHPDRQTRLSCTSCERPICTECMTQASVGQRCPDCAKPSAPVMDAAEAQRRANRSPFTKGVIGVAAAVYVVTVFGGPAGDLVFQLGSQYNPAIADGQWWRPITARFLHSPAFLLHIVFNMLLLWILGRPIEREVGSAAFAALYFGAGLGGAAAYFFLAGDTPAVGASGAVFGLFGAWLAAGLRNRGNLQGQMLLRQIGPLVILNVVISFTPGIAWQAHFGGLLAGFLIAWLWGRLDPRDRRSRVGIGATVAAVSMAAILLL